MKVARNMDSVFSDCTQDELDFDAIFDDDDTILEFVAGLNESGESELGPDFDYHTLEDGIGPAEGSVDKGLSVGSEVGTGSTVTGKEDSAESHAHDTDDFDAAYTKAYGKEYTKADANRKAMEIAAKKFNESIAMENSDYPEYKELIEAVIDAYMSKEDIMSENAATIAMQTADYMIECCDADLRAGKVSRDTSNIEGVKSKVIGAEADGHSSNSGAIDDKCDCGMRNGKITRPTGNVEGSKAKYICAALEGTIEDNNDGDLDATMNDKNDNSDIENDGKIVPDEVHSNTNSNDIEKDLVNTQEATMAIDYVKDHYKDFIGKAKVGLVGTVLENASDDVIAAGILAYREARDTGIGYCESVFYDKLLEAVTNSIDDSVLVREDADSVIEDSADYIVEKIAPSQLLDNTDDNDIAAVNNESDPKVDLSYSYNDDELIDLVADDDDI